MTTGWNDLFRASALGEARTKLGAMAETVIDALIEDFGPDTKATVVDEVLRFRDWLRKYANTAEILEPQRMTIGISVPLGGGQVHISLEADLIIVEPDGAFATARPLQQVLTAQSLTKQCFDIYKSLRGEIVPASPARPEPRPGQQAAPDASTVTVSKLVINIVDGQRRYKLKNDAQFAKFGLTVYEEKLMDGWADLAPGSYDIKPLTVTHDGKKVIAYVEHSA